MCTEAFHSVFCGPVERLTAESVMELFTVQFSEEKEQQEKESTTLNFWKKYLHECDGMFPTGFILCVGRIQIIVHIRTFLIIQYMTLRCVRKQAVVCMILTFALCFRGSVCRIIRGPPNICHCYRFGSIHWIPSHSLYFILQLIGPLVCLSSEPL